ncbi:MAG: replicative DNA helicase [Bacteroidales bacterium]|nr:replicative DNA helicase [Bacteroidales bacterium]MBR6464802.1 replicative DNA helicase [Bacteroidales bacterium]
MAKTVKNRKGEVDLEVSALQQGMKVPQATEVEASVLGAMMLDQDIVEELMTVLQEECFYKQENKLIFKAINNLSNASQPVDMMTVADRLKFNGDFDAAGGLDYLTRLTSDIGAAVHVNYYAKILVDKFIQREMISITTESLRKSYDESESVDDLLNSTQQKLFELSEKNMSRKEQSIAEIIKTKLDSLEKMQDKGGQTGLQSGYMALDKVTYGWHPSDLVIIAGRPGMGKTAFVLTMARNMAVDFKIPVAFFSLEQAPTQLLERLMVAESGLPSDKIKGSVKMTQADWTQLEDSLKSLEEAPIYIDDTPSLSIADLRAKARRLVKTNGVKILIIDYLQLMTGSKELKGNREQEVAEISRSLKAIAKELDVPVITLAQLNRQGESTSGGQKKPQLTHLRESGAIEQDADIVLFLHRPEYYGLEDMNVEKGLTEVIIAKHRNGPTGEVELKFLANQMKFVDRNDAYAQPPAPPTGLSFGSRINNGDYGDFGITAEDEYDIN